MKSLLFFIECLDLGGAEGILNNVVANISKEKFDVTVASERDDEFHTEEIRSNCRHKSFTKQKNESSKTGHLKNALKIKYSLMAPPSLVRKTLIGGKYDIEVAFCEGYSTKIIGSRKGGKTKRIAWVHTDLVNYPWSEKVHGSKENEKKCYENFDRIVCVSETIKKSFVEKYGMEDKISVIYNVIDFNSVIEKSRKPASLPEDKGMNFVLVGSFKPVKGYDRFVKICAELKKQGYRFNATVMGSGLDYNRIKKLVDEHEVGDILNLMEYQANPYKYISRADALICSSYAEGYSTTVCESIVLGTPVITTECSGMREIFGDKECGIICDNSEEGLLEAIKTVLDNPEKLEGFSRNALERAKDFSIEKRIAELEDFLENI